MFIKKIYFLITVLLILFTSSCSGVKIRESWLNGDYKGKFKNVYIYGNFINNGKRIIFENYFKKGLLLQGLKSRVSYFDYSRILIDEKNVDLKKIRSYDCDSLILAEIVDHKTLASFSSDGGPPSHKYLQRPPLKNDLDFSRYPDDSLRLEYYKSGYRAIPEPSEGLSLAIFEIKLRLYDLKNEELVWAVIIETSLGGSYDNKIEELVEEAIKSLKISGLI